MSSRKKTKVDNTGAFCPQCGEKIDGLYEYQKVWQRSLYFGDGEYDMDATEVVDSCDEESDYQCPECYASFTIDEADEILRPLRRSRK